MTKRVFPFFREAREELRKVTWPTREELFGSTAVVIVTMFLLAAFIGSVDYVLSVIIRFLVRW